MTGKGFSSECSSKAQLELKRRQEIHINSVFLRKYQRSISAKRKYNKETVHKIYKNCNIFNGWIDEMKRLRTKERAKEMNSKTT